MVNQSLRQLASSAGPPTVEIDGIAYHSMHNPVREAERFYAGLQLEKADLVFQFGWGLGYAGEILKKRLRANARVIVFEPDEELFKLAAPFTDPRFTFVVGPKTGQFFDDWSNGTCQETDQILWIDWPAAMRRHSGLAADLKRRFQAQLRDRAANLLTHFRNGATYFQNVIRNFEYQGEADVRRLFGRFQDIPLVLVSAGPSLDQNVEQLRGMEDRCFILSVDTALRPLLHNGITPHAVITADPSELNARHVVGALPWSTYLIAEQAVHAAALRSAERLFLFGLGLFPDSLFAKFGFGKGALDSWGSVATCALDLACKLGANPVIFAGQDFAYSWNREYAKRTIYHRSHFDLERCGTAKAPDVYGNEAFTTENLIAYRNYFVRRMKQSPEVRFFNATEGGILTGGAQIVRLEDVLSEVATTPRDIAGILAAAHKPSPVTRRALDHLEHVLKYRRGDCGCLDGFLELSAKKALLEKNEKELQNSIASALDFLCRRGL